MNYIAKISIDGNSIVRGDHNKSERDRVITDLLETSSLAPSGGNLAGPFSVDIAIAQNKILIGVAGACGNRVVEEIYLMPFRRLIKDYSIICASYFEAVTQAETSRIEAIDMGRRGVHNEGAEMLSGQLAGKLDLDFETARKLFTLIYLLQEK
jgi:uncharacterized protein (UPF0262 family)